MRDGLRDEIDGVIGIAGLVCVVVALWCLDWRIGLGAAGVIAYGVPLWRRRAG